MVEGALDAKLGAIPGMTTIAERKALYETARTRISGKAAVVDLGAWMGSLTIPMAMGLKANRNYKAGKAKVHAFDLFVWHDWMATHWPQGIGSPPKAGESFLPHYKRFIEAQADAVEIHSGDLKKMDWPKKPIDLLSVDAAESPQLCAHIGEAFYPALSDRAFLFHQDFCYEATWWIQLHTYQLRKFLEVADPLPGSAGVIFRLKSKPPKRKEMEAITKAGFADPALADAAFAWSLSLVDKIDRPMTAVAHIESHRKNGRNDRAKALLNDYQKLYGQDGSFQIALKRSGIA